MPFGFQWENPERTVIRYSAQGRWDWNEFHKNIRRSTLWFDEVSHPVDAIIDLRGGARMPAGAVAHLRSVGKPHHANSTGRVLILGVDPEIQKHLGAVDGVYRDGAREIYFCDTDEQAQAILERWLAERTSSKSP